MKKNKIDLNQIKFHSKLKKSRGKSQPVGHLFSLISHESRIPFVEFFIPRLLRLCTVSLDRIHQNSSGCFRLLKFVIDAKFKRKMMEKNNIFKTTWSWSKNFKPKFSMTKNIRIKERKHSAVFGRVLWKVEFFPCKNRQCKVTHIPLSHTTNFEKNQKKVCPRTVSELNRGKGRMRNGLKSPRMTFLKLHSNLQMMQSSNADVNDLHH